MQKIEPSGWAEFVLDHIGTDKQAEVATRTGIQQSTISRWLRDDPPQPSAPNVVAFARAYGLSPIEALVAAGVVSADEAEAFAAGVVSANEAGAFA